MIKNNISSSEKGYVVRQLVRRRLIASVMVLSLALPFISAQSDAETSEKVKKETQEAVTATKDYLKEKKEKYEKKIQATLNELENKIAKFSEKAKDAKGELKESLDEFQKNLRVRMHLAKARLKLLADSSEDSWEKIKNDVDGAVQSLKETYETAISKID